MPGLIGKIKRRIDVVIERRRERMELAPLYDPDPADLDVARHFEEAVRWLERAQDAGDDRGVSYGLRFGDDFDVSYPETTGYICQTFAELDAAGAGEGLLRRATEMAHWEADIQLPSGAVMGGKFNSDPTPAVFNTGMVLLGWSAVIRRTGDERSIAAARRASDWLVGIQESDGRWTTGNSQFARSDATVYNVKAAWGLCEAGVALDEPRYVEAAVRSASFALSRQEKNGWFADCCLYDPNAPLLHTLAYSMQGLLGIGRLTERAEFVEGAARLADAQIDLMGPDGFLPGRQRRDLSAAVDWCCLTGSAQTSIVWGDLYAMTGAEKYARAVRLVNRYLMARHDVRNQDERIRGGLAGSWPVWEDYGRLQVLNWATKFLVDALHREMQFSK